MLVAYCAGAIALACIYVIYFFRNKKRAVQREEAGEMLDAGRLAFADLTDLQNPEFIYDL